MSNDTFLNKEVVLKCAINLDYALYQSPIAKTDSAAWRCQSLAWPDLIKYTYMTLLRRAGAVHGDSQAIP